MTKLLSGSKIKDNIVLDFINSKVDLSNYQVNIIYSTFTLDSLSYVKMVEKMGKSLGFKILRIEVNDFASLKEAIDISNIDSKVYGIVVARPLNIENENILIETIDEQKDIDCLTSKNMGKIIANSKEAILSGTAESVSKILDHYEIPLTGQKALVIGRSISVGKPIALHLLNKNCTVTIAHSKTKNIDELVSSADIIVLASGVIDLFDLSLINENCVIIDCGFHITKDGKMSGDLSSIPLAKAYTPVPGGVGPLTTISLYTNLLKLHNIIL